jgi:hypothetical protein
MSEEERIEEESIGVIAVILVLYQIVTSLIVIITLLIAHLIVIVVQIVQANRGINFDIKLVSMSS